MAVIRVPSFSSMMACSFVRHYCPNPGMIGHAISAFALNGCPLNTRL